MSANTIRETPKTYAPAPTESILYTKRPQYLSQPLFCFRFVQRFTPHVKRKHRKFIEKINKHDLGMSRAISN